MKSKVNLVSRILVIVFSMVAILSYFMPYMVFPYRYTGFSLMRALLWGSTIFGWIYHAAVFAGLIFVVSLISLVLRLWFGFKSRGIATTICSLIGVISMAVFAAKLAETTAPSWWENAGELFGLGVGVYVYIVAIALALISAVTCMVTYPSEDMERVAKAVAPYNLNSLSIK